MLTNIDRDLQVKDMYELKHDELDKIIEKEEPEGVEFYLMADEKPYNGIESHRAALLFAMHLINENEKQDIKKRKNFSEKSIRTNCICLPAISARQKQKASTPENSFLFQKYCAQAITEIRIMTATGFPTMKTSAKKYRIGMLFWSRLMGRDTDRKTSGGSMRSCSRTARTVWKRMNGQRTGRMFLMPGMNGGARRAGAYTTTAGTGLSYYWLRQQTDKPQFVRIVHAACIILNRKIPVLLSNDEYDIIKKNFQQRQFC